MCQVFVIDRGCSMSYKLLERRAGRLIYVCGIIALTAVVTESRIQNIGIERPLSPSAGLLALALGVIWTSLVTDRIADLGVSRALGPLITVLILSMCVILRAHFTVGGSQVVLAAVGSQIPLMLLPGRPAKAPKDHGTDGA